MQGAWGNCNLQIKIFQRRECNASHCASTIQIDFDLRKEFWGTLVIVIRHHHQIPLANSNHSCILSSLFQCHSFPFFWPCFMCCQIWQKRSIMWSYKLPILFLSCLPYLLRYTHTHTLSHVGHLPILLYIYIILIFILDWIDSAFWHERKHYRTSKSVFSF